MGSLSPVLKRIHPPGTLNATLVRHAVAMYGNLDTDRVFDLTPGKLAWWLEWKPTVLDLLPRGLDFVDLDVNSFLTAGPYDVVAFDPPYVAKGGRATSESVVDHDDRYGRATGKEGTQLSPVEVGRLMRGGMRSAVGLVAPGGLILQKCADYVTSGIMHWGAHDARVYGRELGLTQVSELVLESNSPQPQGRVQRNFRVGSSSLLIWRKGREGRSSI